uniref:Uncharacterized protein n=1 Tax=Anguilla anguilla TaxID=7936 RepID=A0A0E9U0H0_ANGAN
MQYTCMEASKFMFLHSFTQVFPLICYPSVCPHQSISGVPCLYPSICSWKNM